MPIIIPQESELWQGDIFADVPWSIVNFPNFVQPDGTNKRFIETAPPLPGRRSRLVTLAGRDFAMLISHECIVDKGGRAPLTFARILSITSYREQDREHIRRGSNYQTFYLPAAEGLIPESYVDFRFIVAVDPQCLGQFRRIASLSEEGRESLRHQLILYFARSEPRYGPAQLDLPHQ